MYHAEQNQLSAMWILCPARSREVPDSLMLQKEMEEMIRKREEKKKAKDAAKSNAQVLRVSTFGTTIDLQQCVERTLHNLSVSVCGQARRISGLTTIWCCRRTTSCRLQSHSPMARRPLSQRTQGPMLCDSSVAASSLWQQSL